MLDQMSGGRLELGFGRGASPIELALFRRRSRRSAGRSTTRRSKSSCSGLTSKTLDLRGQAFSLRRRADGARAAAEAASADLVRRCTRPTARRAPRAAASTSSISIRPAHTRATVDQLSHDLAGHQTGSAAAEDRARPLHRRGRDRCAGDAACAPRLSGPGIDSFTYLSRLRGRAQTHPRPAEFEPLMERGQGIAGSPETVRELLARAAHRDRLQLRRRPIRVRRYDARRGAALDRPVRATK